MSNVIEMRTAQDGRVQEIMDRLAGYAADATALELHVVLLTKAGESHFLSTDCGGDVMRTLGVLEFMKLNLMLEPS